MFPFQELQFINLPKQNHVFEEQSIAIQSFPDGIFRFGLYGVYTGREKLFYNIQQQDIVYNKESLMFNKNRP